MSDFDVWWTGYVIAIPGVAGSWISFMYFGAGIWAVISVLFRRFPIDLSQSARFFVLSCLGYALALLISSILNDGARGILPGLAAGAAFYFVPFIISRYRFSDPDQVLETLIAYAPIGAVLSLASALYQGFVLRQVIEGGAGNPSVFGFVAALLGGLSLSNAGSESIRAQALAIVGFLAGVSALLLSRTRVLYPIIVVAPLFFVYLSPAPSRYKFRLLSFLTILAAFSVVLLAPRIASEIKGTFREISQIGGQPTATSLGIRIELWRGALSEIAIAPWLGHGQIHKMDGVFKRLPDLISYVRFTHVHNVWIDSLLSGGIAAFVSIIAILVSLIYLLNLDKRQKKSIRKQLVLYILIFIFIINSILNTLFTNDIMTTLFLVVSIIILSADKSK